MRSLQRWSAAQARGQGQRSGKIELPGGTGYLAAPIEFDDSPFVGINLSGVRSSARTFSGDQQPEKQTRPLWRRVSDCEGALLRAHPWRIVKHAVGLGHLDPGRILKQTLFLEQRITSTNKNQSSTESPQTEIIIAA